MRIFYLGRWYVVSVDSIGCIYIDANPIEHFPKDIQNMAVDAMKTRA